MSTISPYLKYYAVANIHIDCTTVLGMKRGRSTHQINFNGQPSCNSKIKHYFFINFVPSYSFHHF